MSRIVDHPMGSCLVEQDPIPEDLFAEVSYDVILADHIDLCTKCVLQIGEESSEGEQGATIIGEDTEIVVAVGTVVSAGSGSEEVHPAHVPYSAAIPPTISESSSMVSSVVTIANLSESLFINKGLRQASRGAVHIPTVHPVLISGWPASEYHDHRNHRSESTTSGRIVPVHGL